MAYDSTKHFNNYGQNTQTNTHRAVRNDIRTATNDFNPTSANTNSLAQTSTNIFIYAQGSIVGMIQSFSVTENRTVTPIQAIGYEGVVQAVPSNTTGGRLSVTRLALYNSNIWNALGLNSTGKAYNPIGKKVHTTTNYKASNIDSNVTDSDGVEDNSIVFKTLQDQRVPLEIQVKTRLNGSEDTYFYETYIDCWLSSYSKTYSVGTITVSEQAQIEYADVY